MINIETIGVQLRDTIKPVFAENTGAGTLTIVPADANRATKVYGLILSTDTAAVFTLSIGSEVIGKWFLGANGGIAIPNLAPFYMARGVKNEAVTLAKSVAAAVAVTAFIAQTA